MTQDEHWISYLNRPLGSLGGLSRMGRLRAQIARAVGGNAVRHLLLHAPRRALSYDLIPSLRDVAADTDATIHVQIARHDPPPHGRITQRTPYRVVAVDADGNQITIVFFRGSSAYVKNQLPLGQMRVIAGRARRFRGKLSMAHPSLITSSAEALTSPSQLVYDGLRRVPSHQKILALALRHLPPCPDWNDASRMDCGTALATLHRPDLSMDDDLRKDALKRLAYDELLARHLAFALNAQAFKEHGHALPEDALPQELMASLPFHLTPSQESALDAILCDMTSSKRMLRLLQGDVGSGKTIVALLAMLKAALSGYQAALMAPTALLATQTAQIAAKMALPYGIYTMVLHGGDTPSERREKQLRLLTHKNCLVFGTHALFQKKTRFANLALIVIDEQQRFGVAQRLELYKKTDRADVLAMTATPIPRSLWLAQEGTLDVCLLKEKPHGRQKIKSVVVPTRRMDDILAVMARHLNNNERIYWVCPLIEEESHAVNLRADMLETHFPKKIARLHGGMKVQDKQRALENFKKGQSPLLVSTTVIEVGIDVPDATLMIVERAELFGLAQLHQLRGRIGRGGKAGLCILKDELRLLAQFESNQGIK